MSNRRFKRFSRRHALKNNEADVNYKRMMRTQTIHNACASLTVEEVKEAMVVGYNLKYVTTTLDENGVPIDAGIEELKISNIDIRRLESILRHKEAEEFQYQDKYYK